MVFEIATILLGAGLGAVVVLYAAPKGYLGHPRRRAVVATATYTPETEQVTSTQTEARSSPAPAQSPAPAIYETVQPEPAPAPAVSSSSVVSFGSGPAVQRAHRVYRRRTTSPVRSPSSTRSVHHRTKKR